MPDKQPNLVEHSDQHVEAFITAIEALIMSKLYQTGAIASMGRDKQMTYDKAKKQLASYIKPLLCFETEE